MEHQMCFTLVVLTAMLIQEMAARRCPDCGLIPVPYPLTGPGCGDPLYKVRCSSGILWLDALNGSYVIDSINPLTQRLIIRPPGMANNSCMTTDFPSQGLDLDSNLPFNITSSNTVLIFNCTESVLHIYLLLNCSSTSMCHDYIRETPHVRSACGATKVCCWFKTGGSLNEYRIRVRAERCSAYQSFVNLDPGMPVGKWPEPSVELQWELPQEPICKFPVDCEDLANSVCLPDPGNAGKKRCFCLDGFEWDPIYGVCQGAQKYGNEASCSHQKKKIQFICGLTLSAVAMLVGILALVLIYRKRQQTREEFERSLSKLLTVGNSGRMVKIFTRNEIMQATNNFSRDLLLGSGGFGEVFKGITDDGMVIAIKRAKIGNSKGTDQILNEVRILCHINHRSLVRLLGCCVELQQPLLVYEYVPNGTLFDHLHNASSRTRAPLTWHRRLIIAHQTAEAIAYLHFSVTPPIYHRDIKSSNILLDETLDAKVSDFGLSRLAETDATHITTCAQGTLGYLDPEYYTNFQLTDKSDVYSFGVVLLEILTSKKAIDFNREEEDVNLVVYARRILREERLVDAIDPSIKDAATEFGLETMKALGSLAVACLDEKRQNRPTIKEVAEEIEYIISLVTAEFSQIT